MIVCDNPRFAFIHVPRTGGCSLSEYIHQVLPHARLIMGPTPAQTHMQAAEVGRRWPHHPQLCVMRDPWSIVGSMWQLYHSIANNGMTEHMVGHEEIAKRFGRMSFAQFVEHATREAFICPRGGFATIYTLPRTIVFQYDNRPYERLAAYLGISLRKMPRINSQRRDSPAPMWTPELIRLVGNHCHLDVARYGYQAPKRS